MRLKGCRWGSVVPLYTRPKIRTANSPSGTNARWRWAFNLLAMPLEGHWERVNTPVRRLTRRERRVVLVAALATAVTLLALVLSTVGNSKPAPAPGCIYAIVPGVMGATPVDACGPRAKGICARRATGEDPPSRAIRADCRRAGLL